MSKIQSFKRIIIEDFDEKDRKLVSKLAYSMNIFAQDLENALNKGLTIADNLSLVQKDVNVTVDVSGTPKSNIQIKTDLASTCKGVLVIKVTDLVTTGRPPAASPFVTFTENGTGLINITNITGLIGENSYSLRIVLF